MPPKAAGRLLQCREAATDPKRPADNCVLEVLIGGDLSDGQLRSSSMSWLILALAVIPFALIYLYEPKTQTSTAAAIEYWTAVISGLIAGIVGLSQAISFFRRRHKPSMINIISWIGAVVAFGFAAFMAGVMIYWDITCGDASISC